MSHPARAADAAPPRAVGWRGDAAAALVLAGVLTAAWTWVNRAALAAWWLPDTDDAVRLRQILDWIGGQRFRDLAQHRIGFAGVPMHWSRLPDLVPAALIVLLRGVLGEQHAVIVAVVAWPAALFAATLFACARIARAIRGRGIDAMVLAAIAYPATTLFQPGRIDHHGLQIVLLLVVVAAIVRAGGWRRGVAAGVASAASVAIGMEMLPLLIVAGSVIVWRWAVAGKRGGALAHGYAAGLIAALLLAGAVLRTDGWAYPACDGFDATVFRAALAAAGVLAALVVVGAQARAGRARLALVVAAGVVAAGVVAAGLVTWLSPACARPYGAVDPVVARLWLRRVAEAEPLFGADPRWALSYAGLMVAGLVAGVWLAWRTRAPGAVAIVLMQAAALAVTTSQLRGAYAGAVLAAPVLAVVIGAARARGAAAVFVAWLVSAGISYPLLARALPGPQAADDAAVCETPTTIAALARLPAGVVWAPIDLGARIVAMTHHRALAAPYHRDNAGNRFFLDVAARSARRAEPLLRAAGVDYIVACPAAFAPFARARQPGTVAALFAAGMRPAWLAPVADAPGVFRLVPRAAPAERGAD